LTPVTTKVESIRYVDDPDYVCDLTIADNHNLFVCSEIDENSVLAHNCLDENIKNLSQYGTKPYELHHIACRYGDDWYLRAGFSKKDRVTIKDIDLNEEVLNYCTYDVQCLVAIHKAQLTRAATLDFNGKSYKPVYWRFILGVMSHLIHTQSRMEHRGSQLDIKYFMHLLSKTESPIRNRLVAIRKELLLLPNVQKTNKLLLGNAGVPTKGLLGKTSTTVFDPNKVEHKQRLFFDIMKLKALKTGANGPSMNKFFQKAHKEHKEVELIGEMQRLKTILGTYVEGWYKKLSATVDGMVDNRLRPRFGYTPVVTGRSNSTDPNLQNVPEHSKEAKYVKSLFRALIGYLNMDADYSAHEVRGWGLVSNDPVIAQAFQQCLDIIYDWRANPTPETFKRKQLASDIHKINYSLFTGVPVEEVTPEQRQDSKGIGFGSIYGIGMKALSESIKRTLNETKDIVAAFFAKFQLGKDWLDWAVSFSSKNHYVYSPLGRRRNLPGYAIPVPALTSAFERRSKNSPIQSFGSDLGYIAAEELARAIDLVLEELEFPSTVQYFEEKGWAEYLTEFDRNPAFAPFGTNSMVHDSIKNQGRYDIYLIGLHLLEWAMVTSARVYVEKYFGMKFTVDLAVEVDIGASADAMSTWQFNWKRVLLKEKVKNADGEIELKETVVPSIKDLVLKSLEVQKSWGYPIDPEALWKEMHSNYKQHRDYLQENFPIPAYTAQRLES
jgi:hypothetical protein